MLHPSCNTGTEQGLGQGAPGGASVFGVKGGDPRQGVEVLPNLEASEDGGVYGRHPASIALPGEGGAHKRFESSACAKQPRVDVADRGVGDVLWSPHIRLQESGDFCGLEGSGEGAPGGFEVGVELKNDAGIDVSLWGQIVDEPLIFEERADLGSFIHGQVEEVLAEPGSRQEVEEELGAELNAACPSRRALEDTAGKVNEIITAVDGTGMGGRCCNENGGATGSGGQCRAVEVFESVRCLTLGRWTPRCAQEARSGAVSVSNLSVALAGGEGELGAARSGSEARCGVGEIGGSRDDGEGPEQVGEVCSRQEKTQPAAHLRVNGVGEARKCRGSAV